MRGSRGRTPASVVREQTRMSLRKEAVKDAAGVPPEIHRAGENTQVADAEDTDELSLSLLPATTARDRRRRGRENKSKCKEMTEEEMMDLALRLSEQEANLKASTLKQEEEAMMKAIQESMFSQTEPCAPSQSQSLLSDAEAPHRLCSRRKLLYSNGKKTSAIDLGVKEDDVPPLTSVSQGVKPGDEKNNNPNKKRKRKEGRPLPEMPELSQTDRIFSPASPCSSESLSVLLDSPQSSDSTQIEDCQLHKSPVFPLTGGRATVSVPRLSQEVVNVCKTSGFVSCSQDSWTVTQTSLLVQPKSPTFPKSPSNITACHKSPVSSETDKGEGGETELSPERDTSPVFGRTTQNEASPSACKPQVFKNSGFTFSSQESLTSTVRSTTCRPKSPVFPGSSGRPNNLPELERSAICKSPVFTETKHERPEQTLCCSTSPVLTRTRPAPVLHPDPKNSSVVTQAGSNQELDSHTLNSFTQSPREDRSTDRCQDGSFTKISTSRTSDFTESNKFPKDGSFTDTELTSDMTLLWSDEDEDDVTPAGSPSPVFPEERPVHQADAGSPSLTHRAEATPATSGTEHSQGMDKKALTPSEEAAAGPLVHYYWGVPFCPRSLDPNSYTQVILAQMELYEKSLKQAQRNLLRKAEWGEPVLPEPEKSPSPESPQPQRYGFRARGKKLSESGEMSPVEREEEEDGAEKEEEEKQGEVKDDPDDCEVCPETQLSNEDDTSVHDPTVTPDHRSKFQTQSPELPEVEMIQDDSPSADPQMEVDAPEEAQTEGNVSVCRNEGGRNEREVQMEDERLHPDVEEVKDGELPVSAPPELDRAAPQAPEVRIDCPLCQGSFPASQIEVHAAYCDGEVAVVEERCPQGSSKLRRKRTRRADASREEPDGSSTTFRNREKCYICHEAVPLRDYSRHTELCIQLRAAKTQKGNLLTALERTESRDSDAGPSRLQLGDVIDLRDDDDDDDGDEEEEEGGVSAFGISNSPIRSFTPISEASDCLIDFKTQLRTKKPSKRRR